MKTINLVILITFSLIYSARGDLIEIEVMSTRDLANNQAYIDAELDVLGGGDFFNLTVEYGFWLYKIVYETIDKDGHPTQASGIVAYPRVDWPQTANQAFPILSYQHGTALQKNSVSSVTGLWVLPALIAGYGYVYIEPDYLGLGVSEGLHPYQIKEPYGTDIVDILRATDQFSNESLEFQINNQLFLAGYSEGGYATMAAHQVIERDHADEFNITASFPMAGAYSMSGVMTDIMLSYTEYGQPFYFPYVLFAYCDNYLSTTGPAEDYLLPEYANSLLPLFDGMHSEDEINSIMPSIPINIMKPEKIEDFRDNQNHPLRIALEQNDLYDWTPQAPIYIIHGEADELVPYDNAIIAYNSFTANGADEIYLEPLPVSFGGHQAAAPFALLGAFTHAEEMKVINELGDINEDQGINVLDITQIVNIIINYDNIADNYESWASDYNQDNITDILDIIAIINFIFSS